jgi:PIN domain nuclease of toxin-antitoxin system
MRLLLDTHIFLWTVSGDRRLKEHARTSIRDADAVYVSAVSIWEAAIKSSLGKLDTDIAALASEISRIGFLELPLNALHTVGLSKLPNLHRDPFDRILVAQAMSESLRLVTTDRVLAKYSPIILQV